MDGVHESKTLLQSMSNFMVKSESRNRCQNLLKCLCRIGEQLLTPTSCGMRFPDLLEILVTLANEKCGSGHSILFRSAISWLVFCKNYLTQKNVIVKMEQGVAVGLHVAVLESLSSILNYVNEVVSCLKVVDDVR